MSELIKVSGSTIYPPQCSIKYTTITAAITTTVLSAFTERQQRV